MTPSPDLDTIALLGGGNLGTALAHGWARADRLTPDRIHVTRRHAHKLAELDEAGFRVGADNRAAVEAADCIVLAVRPGQVGDVLEEVSDLIGSKPVISVATGVSLANLRDALGDQAPRAAVARAMPNTAVETLSAMTCLAGDDESGVAIGAAEDLFGALGRTLRIDEEMMTPATALCACGIAFFLRTVRAAAQGGTEIGFEADEALLLAAQTARGAADLVLTGRTHPESEIDRVTTPRGCTIAGLNELEHQGFSSAMIRGILTSATRAAELG
ncbi:MAG: pyrroline-5-carboxylate reductase [Gemmatimonadetes bacterium]|nr:pyrroline-5-carboxylate reductase [Gemmatimonadota bacterium]